jgi:hypothetical protein
VPPRSQPYVRSPGNGSSSFLEVHFSDRLVAVVWETWIEVLILGLADAGDLAMTAKGIGCDIKHQVGRGYVG